jgi:argonaute-like protein implicated in RNA metabolism and viral defense
MVRLVSDILKEAGLIGNSYSTQSMPEHFQSGAPQPNLVFANSRVRPYNPAKLAADFRDGGAFHLSERLQREPLRVVVINTLADDVGDFLEALKRSLDRDLKLKLEVVRERNMRVISQANLESAVRLLQKETSDLVLVFLPAESETDEEEAVNERVTRTQTIGRGLPCLIVHESTLNDPSAMTNVILGLIARVSAVPYLLADPLSYVDSIVGLSLIYHGKREGEYVTGISRIFASDGRFLRGIVAGAPAEHGVPAELMTRLFPRDLLHKQRVVIHSDGRLRRDAQRALGSCEDELDATFLPVEILRAGVPRVYALNAGKIDPPRWGSIFRLSDTEAFVQTTDATIQPLHVRAEAPFAIEQAVQSVLLFTLFHYGALKSPKLPVTIHNADPIEHGIVRGVMPPEMETGIPFWL